MSGPPYYYIWHDGAPRPATLEDWGDYMEGRGSIEPVSPGVGGLPSHRHVALDTFPGGHLSTVFLALDHGWQPDAPPVLFESLVFWERAGPDDEIIERYASRAEALTGHATILRLLLDAREEDALDAREEDAP